MMAALSFSRRKMCWNVRVTEVVPAPDEPVIAMTGCFTDMNFSPFGAQYAARGYFSPHSPKSGAVSKNPGRPPVQCRPRLMLYEQRALVEQRRGIGLVRALVVFGMIARYALHFLPRAEYHRHALVQALRCRFEHARAPGRSRAP